MATSAKIFNPLHATGIPINTGRKLSLHKTFIRCPGALLNVLHASEPEAYNAFRRFAWKPVTQNGLTLS